MKYPHLILKNPLGISTKINTSRYRKNKNKNKKVVVKDYSFQKERLKHSHEDFKQKRNLRKLQRTIELPYILEYIEINFFDQFNNDIPNKDYYKETFGLIPVSQRAF